MRLLHSILVLAAAAACLHVWLTRAACACWAAGKNLRISGSRSSLLSKASRRAARDGGQSSGVLSQGAKCTWQLHTSSLKLTHHRVSGPLRVVELPAGSVGVSRKPLPALSAAISAAAAAASTATWSAAAAAAAAAVNVMGAASDIAGLLRQVELPARSVRCSGSVGVSGKPPPALSAEIWQQQHQQQQQQQQQ